MPKLYEYLGLIVLFYANEHEPVHVHGKSQGRESKAELIFADGVLIDVRIGEVRGKLPLTPAESSDFRALVTHFAEDIARKWVDFFVFHKHIEAVRITRRIR